jgi:hypothetical protein
MHGCLGTPSSWQWSLVARLLGPGLTRSSWQRGRALLHLAPGETTPRPSPTAVGRRQVSFPAWLASAGRSQQADQATWIAARLLPAGMSRRPTGLARERLAWSWLTRPPVIRGFALCLPLPNRHSVGLLSAGKPFSTLALLSRPWTGQRRDSCGTPRGMEGVEGEDTSPRLMATPSLLSHRPGLVVVRGSRANVRDHETPNRQGRSHSLLRRGLPLRAA